MLFNRCDRRPCHSSLHVKSKLGPRDLTFLRNLAPHLNDILGSRQGDVKVSSNVRSGPLHCAVQERPGDPAVVTSRNMPPTAGPTDAHDHEGHGVAQSKSRMQHLLARSLRDGGTRTRGAGPTTDLLRRKPTEDTVLRPASRLLEGGAESSGECELGNPNSSPMASTVGCLEMGWAPGDGMVELSRR